MRARSSARYLLPLMIALAGCDLVLGPVDGPVPVNHDPASPTPRTVLTPEQFTQSIVVPAPSDQALDELAPGQLGTFGYRLRASLDAPVRVHEVAVRFSAPLASGSIGRLERYAVTWAPGQLVLARMEGTRSLSTTPVGFVLDGVPTPSPATLSVSETEVRLACPWQPGLDLDLTMQLDGLTVVDTVGARGYLDGVPSAEEVVPTLSWERVLPPRQARTLAAQLELVWLALLGPTGANPASVTLQARPNQLALLPIGVWPLVSMAPADRPLITEAIASQLRTWVSSAAPGPEVEYLVGAKVYRTTDDIPRPLLVVESIHLPAAKLTDLGGS